MLIRGSVAPAIDDLVRDAIVTDEAQPACRLPEPKIGVGKRRGRDRKISEPGTYNVEGFRVRSEPAQCRERGVAFTFLHKITRWRRVHLHRQQDRKSTRLNSSH